MTVGSRFRKRIRLISDAWINLTLDQDMALPSLWEAGELR
jgi:hypothetical protein